MTKEKTLPRPGRDRTDLCLYASRDRSRRRCSVRPVNCAWNIGIPACAPSGHSVGCAFGYCSAVQLRWAHRLKVYVPMSENSAHTGALIGRILAFAHFAIDPGGGAACGQLIAHGT